MSKALKIIVGVIIILLVIVFVSNKSQDKGIIKIGVSTILSGDWAELGQNIVNTSKLAVEEINSKGGIDGKMLELVVEDAGLDSKTGLSATQKLVNIDKVKYIIGGTSSNGTLASAPIVNQSQVVYMTPVTGGSNIDNAGEYVFRTANSDLLAGRDLANAVAKLGYKKIATVTEVTEYTMDIKKSFEQTLLGKGIQVISSEEFQPDTIDFRTIVAKVKSAQPDAILILSQTGIGGAQFVRQAKEAGVNAQLFSDFTFISNSDVKKLLLSLDGIYFADPAYDVNSVESKDFFKRYEETYKMPSQIPFHSASTYDSVMMIATAIREVGDDSDEVHDWLLKNVKNHRGLMGTYSLDEKGNSDLGFIIKQVKGNEFIEVK